MKKLILTQNHLQMPKHCKVETELITNINHKLKRHFQLHPDIIIRTAKRLLRYHWSSVVYGK